MTEEFQKNWSMLKGKTTELILNYSSKLRGSNYAVVLHINYIGLSGTSHQSGAIRALYCLGQGQWTILVKCIPHWTWKSEPESFKGY